MRLFLTLEFSLLVPCSKKTFVGDATLIWLVSEQANIGQNSITMKLKPSWKWNDGKRNSITWQTKCFIWENRIPPSSINSAKSHFKLLFVPSPNAQTEFAISIDTSPSIRGIGNQRLSCPRWNRTLRTKPVRSPFTILDGKDPPYSPLPVIVVGKNSLQRAKSTDGLRFEIRRWIGSTHAFSPMEKWYPSMERTWDIIFPTKMATVTASVSVSSLMVYFCCGSAIGDQTRLLILFVCFFQH